MKHFSQNLKVLRKYFGYTQAEMQAHTGVSGATWSNYEKGDTEPDLDVIIKIAKFFKVDIGQLIQDNFEKGNLIDRFLNGQKQQKSNLTGNLKGNLKGENDHFRPMMLQEDQPEYLVKMPQVITIDTQGNENVVLVPVRARAGYLNGYSDPEFMAKLPAYRLPGLNNGTFRLFEVEGLSMHPTLHGGDLIIGSNVEQVRDVRDDRIYVVVTKNEGVVVKRLLNRISKDGKLILKSDNYKDRDMYPPIVCNPEDILELWYATGFISRQMRPPAEMYNRLIDLEGRLTLLEGDVKKQS